MFSPKKTAAIDPIQREFYEHARKRISQKKKLFFHCIVFGLGALFFVIANLVFGIYKTWTFLDFPWCFWLIMLWSFLLILHACKIWLFHQFMGKEWTDRQMERLVQKQKHEIELIQKDIELMYPKEALMQKKEAFIAEKKNKKTEKNPTEVRIPSQTVTLIAAASDNDVIGNHNALIWHLPNDFARFKELTTGHHIIMGRKTLESLPKLLPNRTHIVISRNPNYSANRVLVVATLAEALAAAQHDPNPYIIGGGAIYALALPFAQKIELTRVHQSFEGDTFFPKLDKDIWELTAESFNQKDDSHVFSYSFLTYERKKGGKLLQQ